MLVTACEYLKIVVVSLFLLLPLPRREESLYETISVAL